MKILSSSGLLRGGTPLQPHTAGLSFSLGSPSFRILWPSWPLLPAPKAAFPLSLSLGKRGSEGGSIYFSRLPLWTCLLGKEEIPHQPAGYCCRAGVRRGYF
jgi:hypothetical protein